MDRFKLVTDCVDNSCGCLPSCSTVASIAIISMIACVLDLACGAPLAPPAEWTGGCARAAAHAARGVLHMVFCFANVLLLLTSIVESALLVRLYVGYTLPFVLLGLAAALAEFLLRYQQLGAAGSCALLAPEVAFLFLIYRCLPLVDNYRKHLEGKEGIEH